MSRAFSTGRFLKALPKCEERAHPDRNSYKQIAREICFLQGSENTQYFQVNFR